MLRCAQAAKPGPDRIGRLWGAWGSIVDAQDCQNLQDQALEADRYSRRLFGQARRYAGEGEVIGDAVEGEVLIVSRDANGKWSKRRERVH